MAISIAPLKELDFGAACALVSNVALDSRIKVALSKGFDWQRFEEVSIDFDVFEGPSARRVKAAATNGG